MYPRSNEKILCPVCHYASTKEEWDKATKRIWSNAAPLAVATNERHNFADKHYVCPECEMDSPVRELIHEHKEN